MRQLNVREKFVSAVLVLRSTQIACASVSAHSTLTQLGKIPGNMIASVNQVLNGIQTKLLVNR